MGNDQRHFTQPLGAPYRPSNGTEGEIFHEKFCYKCARYGDPDEGDIKPCEIQGRALWHYEDHEDYPKEWAYGRDEQPTCTAFTLEWDAPIWYDGPDQLKLFGAAS